MNRSTAILTTVLLLSCGSQGMTIVSPAFRDGGEIPKKYGCSGTSTSPPLSIAGVPATAKSLALVVTDPDAPGGTFTHWVVWNLPAATSSLPEGQTPPGSEGQNDYGRSGYGPPCPPSGSHHYVFDLYALDAMLNLAPSAKRADVENAVKGHLVAQARITGTYRK